jgi:hypothetical protein
VICIKNQNVEKTEMKMKERLTLRFSLGEACLISMESGLVSQNRTCSSVSSCVLAAYKDHFKTSTEYKNNIKGFNLLLVEGPV